MSTFAGIDSVKNSTRSKEWAKVPKKTQNDLIKLYEKSIDGSRTLKEREAAKRLIDKSIHMALGTVFTQDSDFDTSQILLGFAQSLSDDHSGTIFDSMRNYITSYLTILDAVCQSHARKIDCMSR